MDPLPRCFSELQILRDFKFNDFGTADSKGVASAFFGTADDEGLSHGEGIADAGFENGERTAGSAPGRGNAGCRAGNQVMGDREAVNFDITGEVRYGSNSWRGAPCGKGAEE